MLERQLGTNPYRFGLVGSTDSHTALSTAEEDNYCGKLTPMEPHANRSSEPMITLANAPDDIWRTWETSASGYTAVWATENTREAIFDAKRYGEEHAKDAKTSIQERAYTSPIWYMP